MSDSQARKPTDLLAGVRKRRVPSCRYCDQHGDDPMMPAHDPSPRCESGKRAHCTCDLCF